MSNAETIACAGLDGSHEYAEKNCICGAVFCFTCSGGTNVHEGGKYEPDFMLCPICGRDYYKKGDQV